MDIFRSRLWAFICITYKFSLSYVKMILDESKYQENYTFFVYWIIFLRKIFIDIYWKTFKPYFTFITVFWQISGRRMTFIWKLWNSKPSIAETDFAVFDWKYDSDIKCTLALIAFQKRIWGLNFKSHFIRLYLYFHW